MLISASRRTDIPAFYSAWLMNRLREGFCITPNPFNPRQTQHISLRPDAVDALWFWTRDPRPLLPHLDEIESRGYRYVFLITLMDNPPALDPGLPPLQTRLASFRELSLRIGPSRIAWRYDPIVLSNVTPPEFHLRAFQAIAANLNGCTDRSIISFMDIYRKTRSRLTRLASTGLKIYDETEHQSLAENLLRRLAAIAAEHNMVLQACAEAEDFSDQGIAPGKCIDDRILAATDNLNLGLKKDPAQRQACGCVTSKDIGMYNTCPRGCVYCYATANINQAITHYQHHNPALPSLIALTTINPK